MKNMKNPLRTPCILFLGLVLAVLSSGPVGAVSSDEDRLLRLAPHDKDNGTVRSLLAEGVNPNVPGIFGGRTAVHNAAHGGAVQNLAATLQAGGKPNVQDHDGNTPLHLASMGSFSLGFTNHPGAVRILLQYGADLHRTNGSGETPLHVATLAPAHLDVIKALLAAGARPQQVDGNGLTVLQQFVRSGSDNGEIVTLLVQAGADPDRKDPRGDAPLHAAIKEGGSHGKAEIVEALLAGGADPCVRDAQEYTPYQMSYEMQRIHQALDRAYGFDSACDDDSQMVYEEGDGSEDDSEMAYEESEGSDDSSEMTYGNALQALEEKVEAEQRAEAARLEEARRQEAAEAERRAAEAKRRAEAEFRAFKERVEAERREAWEASRQEAAERRAEEAVEQRAEAARIEHQMVTVSGNTQLSKYEVTQALWEAVMGTNPSKFAGCAQCPVEMVSWDDTQVFLGKLNALTGEQYRLPTAEEWVGAMGDDFGERPPEPWRTHPVGQKSPNELGLYDMKGNVGEWVEDCSEAGCSSLVDGFFYYDCGRYFYGGGSVTGCIFRDDDAARSAWHGFRLARTLTP